MTILINQTPVDFTLESEKTLGDLTQALHQWAASQGLVVVSVLADGRVEAAETPLESIGVVAVDAVAQSELPLTKATVLGEYFGLVAAAAQQGQSSSLAALEQEYPLIDETAREFFPDAVLAPWRSPWRPSVTEQASGLVRALDEWKITWASPEAVLDRVGERLRSQLATLATLAGAFQQGRDTEAFEAILDFFTVVEDVRRVTQAHGGEVAAVWKAILDELSPFLRDIRDALDAQDYILLTDLLEYEVVPRLQDGLPRLRNSNLDPASGVL